MNKKKFMKDKNVHRPNSKKDKKKNKDNDCSLKFKQEPNDEPTITLNIRGKKHIENILNQISSKVEETDENININNNKIESIQMNKCTLQRNKSVDKTLKEEYEKNIKKCKSSLPIFKKREEILDLIDKNQVIVIYSEQNCGKTTQIPQFILNNMIKNGDGSLCKIISTQPYKNKVTEAFKKVSEERKSDISYQIRFEKYKADCSPLFFCTSGIFLKLLSNSFILNNTSHLIIDEIQERDVPTDILLGIIKEIIKERHDFKLILMCSTGYSKKIVKYFDDCPKICVTPDICPIDEHYLEDILMLTDFKNLSTFGKLEKKENMHKKYPQALTNFVKTYELHKNTDCELIICLINHIYFKTRDGNILVLLPNISEVKYVQSKIENHSTLSKTQVITFLREENCKINNKRKIFVTSNEKFIPIHESNIMYIINSGRIQNYKYDTFSNVETYIKTWISKKTLRERQKLAGRYKQGVCFHLFSQSTQENFHKYPEPKINIESTDEIILKIKEFGVPNVEEFLQTCLTSPDIYAIRKTIEIFKQNNILTEDELLTPIGIFISKLPVKYSVGKMVILGLLFSCLRPVLIIAAYFNFRNIFAGKDSDVLKTKQSIGGTSDILLFMDLWNEFKISKETKEDFCNLYNINLNVMNDVENIIQQISLRLFNMGLLESKDYTDLKYNFNSDNFNLVKSLLCISLYPNIAVIRKHTYKELKDAQIETIFNQKVHIQMSSINYNKIASSPLLLYRYISQQKHIMIQETSVVTPLQLLVFANDVKMAENGNENVITIAGLLKIQCNKQTALVIQMVREKFQQWLDYRMCYPKSINWEENIWDTLTMESVLQLLSREI